ncbi:hypothetical protein AB0F18_26850 [Streptomyces sp. NPDC029216]|uniref:hypothetical protein n=1 Tax=Streptomyces sp. NPDC029216 TaxID=3154701 RepID=UPI0033F1E16F
MPEVPEGPEVPEQWEGLDRAAARLGQAKLAQAPLPFAVAPEAMPAAHDSAWFAGPRAPQAMYEGGYNPQYVEGLEPTPVMPPAGPEQDRLPEAERDAQAPADEAGSVDEEKFAEAAYEVFRAYIDEFSQFPNPEQLDIHLSDRLGITHPRSASTLKRLMPELKQRYQRDLENEHIA